MNQRTTGLVVGLVTFVILTVGLTAASIYFFVGMQDAKDKAKNAGDAQRIAQEKDRKTEEAYGQLVGFVMGDPNARPEGGIDRIKEALGAGSAANLKAELEGLRAKVDQLQQDKDNLDKLVAAAKADAESARNEAKQAKDSAQAASKSVEDTLGQYKTANEKYGEDVKTTVAAVEQVQKDAEARRRDEAAKHERDLAEVSGQKAELSTRLNELQKVVDQSRVHPTNPAQLVDGRILDVGGPDGEVYLSIGAKQRVQPGLIFEVYDNAESIKYDPSSGQLIPGKARVVVLKVGDTTSTARVIRDGDRSARTRPVVKDDVIANAIYSPDYRYKFLVHGKFDIDGDGVATAAETEYVRGRIKAWGGEVVEGDKLRGDLDFVVMGVQPTQPPPEPADMDTGAYTALVQAKKAYDSYIALVKEANEAGIPVLNWNRMQVLTNEGR